MYGFSREGERLLGHYEPGARPQLFDPTWTQPRNEWGVITHEHVHQQLTTKTHFGILTQQLRKLASAGGGKSSFSTCLEEQWSVQEIAAIVAEMAYIAANAPGQFENSVSELPAGILGKPPYRELFEAARSLLPIGPHLTGPQCRAAHDTILVLAAVSMCSNCLLHLSAIPFEDERYAAYLRGESPHRRFEYIVNAIGAESLQRVAAEGAASRAAAVNESTIEVLIPRMLTEVHAMVRDLPYQPIETLLAQMESAEKALHRAGQPNAFVANRGKPDQPSEVADLSEIPESMRKFLFRQAPKQPSPSERFALSRMPEIVDSLEKQELLHEFMFRQQDNQPTLPEWLELAARTGGYISLLLGPIGGGATARLSFTLPA